MALEQEIEELDRQYYFSGENLDQKLLRRRRVYKRAWEFLENRNRSRRSKMINHISEKLLKFNISSVPNKAQQFFINLDHTCRLNGIVTALLDLAPPSTEPSEVESEFMRLRASTASVESIT